MKKLRKKWLSFIMALAMTVSMFSGISIPVSAEKTDTNTTIPTESEAEKASAVAEFTIGDSATDIYDTEMDYESKTCTVWVPDYRQTLEKVHVAVKEDYASAAATASCTNTSGEVSETVLKVVTDPEENSYTRLPAAKVPFTYGFGTAEMTIAVKSELGTENWTIKILRTARTSSGSGSLSVKDANGTAITLATSHNAGVFENENKKALTTDSVTLTLKCYNHSGERGVTVNGEDATVGTASGNAIPYTYVLDTSKDVTTAEIKIAAKDDASVKASTYVLTFYRSTVIRKVVVDQDAVNLQGKGTTATVQAEAQNTASTKITTDDFTWTVEDSNIAAVTADPSDPSKAVFTAIGDGLTKFTVTCVGYSAEGVILSEVDKKVDVLSSIAIKDNANTTDTFATQIDHENKVITAVMPIGTGVFFIYPTAAEGKMLSDADLDWQAYDGQTRHADLETKGYLRVYNGRQPFVSSSIVSGNDMTMTLIPAVGDPEVWTIKTVRETMLSGFEAVAGDGSAVLISPDFKQDTTEYSTKISSGVGTLTFTITPTLTTKDAEGVYTPVVRVNGELAAYDAEKNAATYTMNVTEGKTKVVLTVAQEGENATVARKYTLNITAVAPTAVTFATVPENAIVNVVSSDNVHQNSNNKVYGLLAGTYAYTVTAPGYKAVTGTLTVGPDAITKKIELEKAPEGNPLTQLESDWPQYNRNEDNNAVTSAATPIMADSVALKWTKKIGMEVTSSAAGQAMLVNDRLYHTSGTMLIVTDKDTGENIMSQKLSVGQGYQYMPPVYGDGMIFVGETGGIEAFNAETLEPLWKYTDNIGGTVRSQMRYEDGYLYGGFFNSDAVGSAGDANWVCIDVTDEDPTSTNEAKSAAWRLTHRGGFYWAGSWTNEKYMFLTSDDDGSSQSLTEYSTLYCLDKRTGDVIQEISIPGAVRGGITYYNGRIYFTSTVGHIHSYNITDNGEGILDTENLIEPLYCGGRSTNTPVIYNNRLYYSSASGSSGPYKDAGIHVINIDPETGALSYAYNLNTAGNCQGSGVLSTAYVDSTGYVYVYFCANTANGSVYMLEDKAGATKPGPNSGLLYNPESSGSCINRVVISDDGVLYYKNDSGTVDAIVNSYVGLNGMTASGGNAVIDGGEVFDPSITVHEVTVDAGTEEVTLTFQTAESAIVYIDSASVVGSYDAVLTDGAAIVKATVVDGNNSRVYTINIREKSNDADLHALVVTESETYEENSNLSPALSSDVTAYENKYLSTCETVYVWPEVNEYATIEVTAGDGVESITQSTDGSYYVVNLKSDAESAVVKLNVAAEDTKITKEYTLTLVPYDILVESITLSATEFALKSGGSKTLTATLNPTEATNLDEIRWTSSDDKVAAVTVDANNPKNAKVVGVADGTATITMSVGEVSATATVRVDTVPMEAAVTFTNRTETTVNIHVNASEYGAVFACVQLADAAAPNFPPQGNPMCQITEENIDTGVTVTVNTLTADEYKFYYRTMDKAGNYTDIVELMIPTYVALTDIIVDKTEVSLTKEKNTEDVSITFNPENTSEAPTITWTSSDDAVVTVKTDEADAKKAVLTAVGDGTAAITVTAGSFTQTVTVTCDVTPAALTEEDVTLANRTDEAVDMTIKTAEACTVTYVVGGDVLTDAASVLNSESAKTVVLTADDLEAGKTETITGLTMNAVNVYMVATDNMGNVSEVVTILIEGSYPDGDMNHDGIVNVMDIAKIVDLIDSTNPEDLALADLNGDGMINVMDIAYVVDRIPSV